MNRNSIHPGQIRQLRKKCLEFYIESLNQIKNRFPFEDEHRQRLKNLRFLNPDILLDSNLKRSVPSIAHLGQMFPGNMFIINFKYFIYELSLHLS